MISVRSLFCALVFFCMALPAFGQFGDGHIRTGDTLKIDTSGVDGNGDGITIDTLIADSLDPDSAFFQDIDSAEDVEPFEPETFFRTRGGFFGSLTVDLTALDPHTLDPALSGNIVIYGAQGYILINSWIVGGGGASSALYDLDPSYERFNFGYGGFLTGYDTKMFNGVLSLQGSLLIGAGGLEMLKKRPDIADSTGKPILEQYRDEGFFLLKPGLSIGYSPIPYLEFGVGASYLYPIGGENVSDLRALTYGLRITFGLGD